MQNLSELPPEYLTSLSKLDELLRYFLISKKSDKFGQIADRAKIKINDIIETLKKFDCFSFVEEDVIKKVNRVFEPSKPRSVAKSNKPSVKFSEKII